MGIRVSSLEGMSNKTSIKVVYTAVLSANDDGSCTLQCSPVGWIIQSEALALKKHCFQTYQPSTVFFGK